MAQSLYSIFVQPSTTRPPSYTPRAWHRLPRQQTQHPQRAFTTTRPSLAKTRAPEIRKQLWDDEIKAQLLYIIDPATNQLPKDPETEEILPPQTRYDILKTLDRKTHRLIQVGEPEDPSDRLSPVACKIVSKKQVYEADKKKKAAAKVSSGVKARADSVKTLEMNWAIDGNDLGHRLGKVRQFLEEGRKVEVVLAAKKRGRKASLEECQGVLDRVREVVGEVKGAKEAKPMEGKVGGFATVSLDGNGVLKERQDG